MMKYIIPIVVLVLLSSCASTTKHEHTTGSIVALDSKTEGHVCLTSNNSTLGELVDVYEVICTKNKVDSDADNTGSKNLAVKYATTCNKFKKGHARVIENSDKHFSKIRSEEALELREGFLIETSQTVLK